jgi:anti-sigma B factor antagonist
LSEQPGIYEFQEVEGASMSSGGSIFSADVVHQNGSVVLRLTGELDIATAPVLRKAVDALVSPYLRALILDVEELSFVDVVGLRTLEQACRAVTAVHGEFRLRSVGPFTLKLIHLVGFGCLEDAVEPVVTDPSGETPVLA